MQIVGQLKAYAKGFRESWNQFYYLFPGKLGYSVVQPSKHMSLP